MIVDWLVGWLVGWLNGMNGWMGGWIGMNQRIKLTNQSFCSHPHTNEFENNRHLRLRYRLLAHALAGAVHRQLGLDVAGHVYAVSVFLHFLFIMSLCVYL